MPGAWCPPAPDQNRIHPAPATDAPGATLVTLRPRASTSFSLIWVGVICIEAPHQVDFEVPHDRHVLTVKTPNMCTSPLSVTPIGTVAHKLNS
jgi:hypothetical protein